MFRKYNSVKVKDRCTKKDLVCMKRFVGAGVGVPEKKTSQKEYRSKLLRLRAKGERVQC